MSSIASPTTTLSRRYAPSSRLRRTSTQPSSQGTTQSINSRAFLSPRTRIEHGAGDPSGGVLRERDLRAIPAVDVERLLGERSNDYRLARLEFEERAAADGLDDELALIHPDIEERPAGLSHEGKIRLCRLILALDLQPGGAPLGPAEPADHLIE